MIARRRGQHGSGIREASTYLGQKYIVADSALIPELLQVLRDQEHFDYCVDTAARADAQGNLLPIPVREYFLVRRDMENAAARTNDFYGRWAQRFLERHAPSAGQIAN